MTLTTLAFHAVQALLFGSLTTKSIPLSHRNNCDSKRPTEFVYVLHSSRILTCCDDDHKVHYFFEQNNTITRCFWEEPTDRYTKCVILNALKSWYVTVGHEDLFHTSNGDDDIWDSSDEVCDF